LGLRGDRGAAGGAPAALDARIPFVVVAILPEAALAAKEAGERRPRLDPADIFGVLVAELALDPEPERRAIGNGEQLVVHPPGEDRLRVEGVDQVDALIIRPLAIAIQAMEDDVARLVPEAGAVEDQGKRRPGPFADRRPALDAVVAGELGAARLALELGEREQERAADEPVHLESPVREPAGGEAIVIGR